MKIYVNGVNAAATIINNDSVTSIADTATPLRLGVYIQANTNHENFFKGLIDEAQIYNRALSASEIQNIYNSGSAGVCQILGPTVWLKAENNANDSTGNTTGTAQGGVSYSAGKVGQAFSFNGSNGSVRLTDANQLLYFRTSDFTFSTWLKTTASGTQDIFQRAYHLPNGVSFTIDSNHHGRFYIRDGNSNFAVATGTTALNDGVWHHVVGERSGTTALLYVDGILQASQSNASLGSIGTSCGTDLIGADTGATN